MGDLSTFLLQLLALIVVSVVIGGGLGWLTDRKDQRR